MPPQLRRPPPVQPGLQPPQIRQKRRVPVHRPRPPARRGTVPPAHRLLPPPPNASESCWAAYQALASDFVPNFDIRASCGFETSWISQGCMNITTRQQFEALVGNATLKDVIDNCNQSLANSSPCASCTTSLSTCKPRI
ncbi:hypothetical protein Pyn_31736 [Prunus yedoensis var. nudiflora]|uniref:SPARK domain-containing protein n=1 Tax=Prunus yedoensis var. nudiflora TaxID=2094558 RepID=A0A314UEZ2_PRUYE|nr:hypothetical protein Pyn_31736 [Prunus yedoensis var. nudiflora]